SGRALLCAVAVDRARCVYREPSARRRTRRGVRGLARFARTRARRRRRHGRDYAARGGRACGPARTSRAARARCPPPPPRAGGGSAVRAVPDVDRVERAAERAAQHIMKAQRKDGGFRYLLDPFTGKPKGYGFEFERQAGSVLALCELARDAQPTAARVLQKLS